MSVWKAMVMSSPLKGYGFLRSGTVSYFLSGSSSIVPYKIYEWIQEWMNVLLVRVEHHQYYTVNAIINPEFWICVCFLHILSSREQVWEVIGKLINNICHPNLICQCIYNRFIRNCFSAELQVKGLCFEYFRKYLFTISFFSKFWKCQTLSYFCPWLSVCR